MRAVEIEMILDGIYVPEPISYENAQKDPIDIQFYAQLIAPSTVTSHLY